MNRDTRFVALALLLWGFGEGLFYYIQPLYIEQLGASPVQIGGVLSISAVVRAVSYLPAGIMADRLPRKWLMVGGWVTGLIGVLLVGLARSWYGLIPGLVVYALSGYCIPVINVYLAHAIGGRDVARTFTTVFAGFAAGGIVSPAVGGWLAEITSMRMVYFASALLFGVSTLVIMQVSPQRARERVGANRHWHRLLNGRFFRFALFVCLIFVSMYLAFPLASNFLKDTGGWTVARIGALGSFQALGMTLLNPMLGRLGDGGQEGQTSFGRSRGPARGLLAGQLLVWSSVLILLLAGAFPVLALAYVLRGAYQSCRSLTQARAISLARDTERGLLLGATETVIAGAQIIAPYAAGWLYASDPAYPFIASLAFIPVALLVTIRSRF